MYTMESKELKTEIDQLRKDLVVLRMKGTSRGKNYIARGDTTAAVSSPEIHLSNNRLNTE